MKLLYITKSMPYGSAEAFIFPEIAEHLENGCEVKIAPTLAASQIHNSPLLEHSFSPKLFSGAILGAFLGHFLLHPIRTFSLFSDLVEPSSAKVSLRNFSILPKGIWLGQKAREMDIDHIHVHWIAVPASLAMVAAKVSSTSWSITAHRYDIAQQNLVQKKYDSATFVRAIDQAGKEEIEAQLSETPSAVKIIRMGVEIADEVAPAKPGILPEPRIAIGARLIEKKAHEYVIASIPMLKEMGVNPRISAFGDGPLEDKLRKQAAALDVTENIDFCGPLPHDELLARMHAGEFDLCILPSVTAQDGDKEGIPVFLMESMAAGIPVVATPNGGIAELIDEESGILVPERDAKALAEAIAALAKDEKLRQGNIKAARKSVLSEFGIKACAAKLREEMAVSV